MQLKVREEEEHDAKERGEKTDGRQKDGVSETKRN